MVSILVALWSDEHKLAAFAPAVAAFTYIAAIVGVVRLFKKTHKKSTHIMQEMQRIALEPLTQRVIVDEEEVEE